MGDSGWGREAWEASVSSRCWWCTPYDEGWDANAEVLATDDEMRDIVAMERAIPAVPAWAEEIVTQVLNHLPMCGHYAFPAAFEETVEAIGVERRPKFLHTCFSVGSERKCQMLDYVLCLDAWAAGAPPEHPALELEAMGYRNIDWSRVCTDVWAVLGEHTPLKDALVERLIQSQRRKVKSSPWDDDAANCYLHGVYVGAYRPAAGYHRLYVGDSVWLPEFDDEASPRVQRTNADIRALSAAADTWLYYIEYGWLCAPKAFRYLERLIWAIGREHPPRPDDVVASFLGCDDLVPDQRAAAQWWHRFRGALDDWWRGNPSDGSPEAYRVRHWLGEATDVKRWLVRLFLARCQSYVDSDENHNGTLLLE